MIRRLLTLVALLALCQIACVPAPKPSSSELPQPEWHVRAEENQRAGASAYAARLAAAPRRAPADEITVFLQVDAMDFFRKSFAHHNIDRDFKVAFDGYTSDGATPSVRVTNQGGGIHEDPDWYQSMVAKHQQVDVYVMFTFRSVGNDEAVAACPDVPRPMLIGMSVRWSSAYQRKDHTVDEFRYCRAGYPEDLREGVAHMGALIARVMAHIDTTLRAELPSPQDAILLSPPYRAAWPWKRFRGGGGGIDIF